MTDTESRLRVAALTVLAMLAFAGNSLLCRLALKHTAIDATAFTTIRIVSGCFVLWGLVRLRNKAESGGSWLSAAALFVYAAGFSFAYISLSAATGALLLFGAVQFTMIVYGFFTGERLGPGQFAGLILAGSGLVVLLLPGFSAPSPWGAFLMVVAGAAWGVYSIRGRSTRSPLQTTAGNFLRATPLALVLSAVAWNNVRIDAMGITYAVLSGAVTSGIGYAIWYAALPALGATRAATVQLSVPLLAAIGGVLFLGEEVTWRLLVASLAILGGIAFVILGKRRARAGISS